MLVVITLTPPAHAHVYILEKSQHKVPEEALKVSDRDNTVTLPPFSLQKPSNSSVDKLFIFQKQLSVACF